ncbi:hypothetical protein [Antrihabitans spumae]
MTKGGTVPHRRNCAQMAGLSRLAPSIGVADFVSYIDVLVYLRPLLSMTARDCGSSIQVEHQLTER